MLTEHSIELLAHCVSSFNECFQEELAEDRILAMVLNTTLLVHGLRDLKNLWTHEDGKYDQFVARAKQNFKDAIVEMIKPTEGED
eukprot:10365781-Ditylum_brightwellii.AAC.1